MTDSIIGLEFDLDGKS